MRLRMESRNSAINLKQLHLCVQEKSTENKYISTKYEDARFLAYFIFQLHHFTTGVAAVIMDVCSATS